LHGERVKEKSFEARVKCVRKNPGEQSIPIIVDRLFQPFSLMGDKREKEKVGPGVAK